MMPLSRLSRVELGLLRVPQGLPRVPQGLPWPPAALPRPGSVEQGLSVLGDVVLLVSVEHGLTPRLATAHCGARTARLLHGQRTAATRTRGAQQQHSKQPICKQNLREAEA